MKDILFGNNNAAIIKRLSSRYFEAGKSRNVIAGVAIALTTLLFTAIFTLGSGLMVTVRVLGDRYLKQHRPPDRIPSLCGRPPGAA